MGIAQLFIATLVYVSHFSGHTLIYQPSFSVDQHRKKTATILMEYMKTQSYSNSPPVTFPCQNVQLVISPDIVLVVILGLFYIYRIWNIKKNHVGIVMTLFLDAKFVENLTLVISVQISSFFQEDFAMKKMEKRLLEPILKLLS